LAASYGKPIRLALSREKRHTQDSGALLKRPSRVPNGELRGLRICGTISRGADFKPRFTRLLRRVQSVLIAQFRVSVRKTPQRAHPAVVAETRLESQKMYIFNHIPKTGGTTMYRIIERLIGSDRLSPHFSINEDMQYDPSTFNFDKYSVIFGHMGAVWNEVLGPRRKWMTILRDPVDRVVSQYYYWRNCNPESSHLTYIHAAQTHPLAEFVRLREEKILQGNENGQTWQLADDFRVRYRSVPPRDVLDIAKRNLVEQFVFIGIFEDYTGSVERLCRLFGTPLNGSIPTENRTPGRSSLQEIAPGVIDAIRELNSMDQELYEYGKARAAKMSNSLAPPH
jgi:hypothetical protein